MIIKHSIKNIYNKSVQLILLVLLFYTNSSNSQVAQNEIAKITKDSIPEYIEISGVIMDIEEAASKVVVLERGKKNVVMTDNNGNFSIKIPFINFKKKVYLRFEVLNLKPKEIEVQPNTKHIKIQLTSKGLSSKGWEIHYENLKPDVGDWLIKKLTKCLPDNTSQ